MRVLIFGQTGQVARELVRHKPPSWDLVSLGRADADLRNPGDCARRITKAGADAVINAAAFTAVDKAEELPELAHTINAEAPGAMAEAAARIDVPFLHVSTDYVFSGAGSEPWHPDDTPAPLNTYGASKLAGEQAVAAAGGPSAILRTAWVFSAHGTNFVKTMLRLADTHTELRVVNDQTGGPTPAAAIAQALLAMAQHMRSLPHPHATYHFTGAPDTTWADLARAIFAHAGKSIKVTGIPTTDYPTPAARPMNGRLDCSDLARVFGIERPDWRTGLSDVLDELKAT